FFLFFSLSAPLMDSPAQNDASLHPTPLRFSLIFSASAVSTASSSPVPPFPTSSSLTPLPPLPHFPLLALDVFLLSLHFCFFSFRSIKRALKLTQSWDSEWKIQQTEGFLFDKEGCLILRFSNMAFKETVLCWIPHRADHHQTIA